MQKMSPEHPFPATVPTHKYTVAAMKAQELDLLPIVGQLLMDQFELIARHEPVAEVVEVLFRDWVTPYLKEAIFVRFAEHHGIEISAYGLVKNQSSDIEHISHTERRIYIDSVRALRDIYEKRLIQELESNYEKYSPMYVRTLTCGEKGKSSRSFTRFELV